jgi:transposase
MKCAIGIDPDSRGLVCALVNAETTQVITRGFLATEEGLAQMLRWVSKQGQVLVAVEGTHGQSQPIEKAFREAGIVFYSFRPGDTDKFRKAVLGQNKNNQRDAESVACYALALESQGRLERYKRVWFPDMNLQLLTRRWESLSQQITAEVNRLWKLLRYASVDLYLALGGKNPQVDCQEQKGLKNQGFLTLLASQPDIGTWKTLSDEQLLQAMGGGNYKGRSTLITNLRPLMQSFPSLSASLALLLKSSALQIQRFRDEQLDLSRALEDLSLQSIPTQTLSSVRGIGIPTASTLTAEIIDIRRFAAEDSLACYSGLGMNEHSTGQTVRMLPTRQFNHRLKDAFMTAALNYVHYNPDSHLAGYHRNLIRKGMDRTQATKRVARALVRVVYRLLSGLPTADGCSSEQKINGGESEVASGQRRSDRSRRSNTSPSTPKKSKAKRASEVKAKIPNAVGVRVRRKRRTLPKKTA